MTLALSRPLLAWLREDPAWARLPLTLRTRLAWQAGWGSANARLARALADGDVARPDLADPVLIVGPWRSGTTVMHELLSAATGCSAPLTWQCMNACAFQLGAPRAAAAASARPMDGLAIRSDSPQEDEFALLSLGVPSAYRAFWMPHRIGELHDTLDAAYWLANPGWLPAWEAFLQGVIQSSGRTARQPLILKSPNHSYRLPALLQRFPKARVVWMARSASEVLASNRKMWRTMFATHGLSQAEPLALDRFLAAALARAAQMLDWCRETLPAAQWCMVPQHRLLAAPEATVRHVCQTLGLGPALDEVALARAIAETAQGRVERYEDLAEQDAACADAVRRLDAAQSLA